MLETVSIEHNGHTNTMESGVGGHPNCVASSQLEAVVECACATFYHMRARIRVVAVVADAPAVGVSMIP